MDTLYSDLNYLKYRLGFVPTLQEETTGQPPWHKAIRAGDRFISNTHQSVNGLVWTGLPNTLPAIPAGWRRDRVTTLYDASRGVLFTIVNARDIDLGSHPEPAGAIANDYLRYGLSWDFGKTWSDEQIVCVGQTEQQPIPGVTRGLNAIYIGDIGSVPIIAGGAILVPAIASVLNQDGKTLMNPRYWFFDAVILRGTWSGGNLAWTCSKIAGDLSKSSRGFTESTLTVLRDGRILCVIRGSNGTPLDPQYKLPSRKWASYSGDGGLTWSAPVAWDYDDGSPLVSPSSMSTLFRHSSGRIFWVGNDSDQPNVKDSLPRYPLVLIEVDARSGVPMRASRVVLADKTKADESKGRLDISHAWVAEDLAQRLVITFPVNHNEYQFREWRRIVLSV